MKTVILCGGLGTRLAEETDKIPKPIVKIGKIELTKTLQIFEFGKNINTNQNGIIPIFNHK